MRFEVFLALLLTANAATLPQLAPRGNCLGTCCSEDAEDAPEMHEMDDGPTDSGAAGIGAEFETYQLNFAQEGCSQADTYHAKGKKIPARAGTNFVLTADTASIVSPGSLTPEWILDGTKIKVGDGSAAAAGRAVYQNWVSACTRIALKLAKLNLADGLAALGRRPAQPGHLGRLSTMPGSMEDS